MKRVRSTRNWIFLAAVAVLAALSSAVLTPLEAAPANEVEIFFYDAQGNEVGWWFRGCTGERISEGIITDNKLLNSEPCSGPPPVCLWQCFIGGIQVPCSIWHPFIVGCSGACAGC